MQAMYFLMLGLLSVDPPADARSQEEVEFFEKKIRPLLVEHCYECHGERKQQGSLRLDHPDGWLQGGDTGPALVPGKPDESLLMVALAHQGTRHASSGEAPRRIHRSHWPMDRSRALAPSNSVDVRTPVGSTSTPAGSGGPINRSATARFLTWRTAIGLVNSIDAFVSQRHQQAGLQPPSDADRETLLRRLSIDLLGLPVDIEDLKSFESAEEPDAYERIIDRYLASPRFAERWTRHWLDIVPLCRVTDVARVHLATSLALSRLCVRCIQ